MGIVDSLKNGVTSIGSAVTGAVGSVASLLGRKPAPQPSFSDIGAIKQRVESPFSMRPAQPSAYNPTAPEPTAFNTLDTAPEQPMPQYQPAYPQRVEPRLEARTMGPPQYPATDYSNYGTPAQPMQQSGADLALIRSQLETINERLKVIEHKLDDFEVAGSGSK